MTVALSDIEQNHADADVILEHSFSCIVSEQMIIGPRQRISTPTKKDDTVNVFSHKTFSLYDLFCPKIVLNKTFIKQECFSSV